MAAGTARVLGANDEQAKNISVPIRMEERDSEHLSAQLQARLEVSEVWVGQLAIIGEVQQLQPAENINVPSPAPDEPQPVGVAPAPVPREGIEALICAYGW